MRKTRLTTLLIALLIIIRTIQLDGQIPQSAKVDFLNAPGLFKEGGFIWSYQITSTADTSNTFATKYGWSERNPFPTRIFPAGAAELKIFSMGTLKITGSSNIMLMNSRPAFTNTGALLLRFREVEGLPGEVKISSAIPGKSVRSMTEVNAAGIKIGLPITSVKLKPFEVRFIEAGV